MLSILTRTCSSPKRWDLSRKAQLLVKGSTLPLAVSTRTNFCQDRRYADRRAILEHFDSGVSGVQNWKVVFQAPYMKELEVSEVYKIEPGGPKFPILDSYCTGHAPDPREMYYTPTPKMLELAKDLATEESPFFDGRTEPSRETLFNKETAHEVGTRLLQEHFPGHMELRDFQKRVIERLMGGGSALVIQPAKEGKPVLLQVQAMALLEQSRAADLDVPSIIIVITNTRATVFKQSKTEQTDTIRTAPRITSDGIHHEYKSESLKAILAGEVDLLYVLDTLGFQTSRSRTMRRSRVIHPKLIRFSVTVRLLASWQTGSYGTPSNSKELLSRH